VKKIKICGKQVIILHSTKHFLLPETIASVQGSPLAVVVHVEVVRTHPEGLHNVPEEELHNHLGQGVVLLHNLREVGHNHLGQEEVLLHNLQGLHNLLGQEEVLLRILQEELHNPLEEVVLLHILLEEQMCMLEN
jgi:hypothetical protein